MNDVLPNVPEIRGRKIKLDEAGRVSLNDIHAAAGFSKHQRPQDWTRLPTTSRLYRGNPKGIRENPAIGRKAILNQCFVQK